MATPTQLTEPIPTLSPRHTLFLMYILEGRSYKEIAALEGIAVPTVGGYFRRIRGYIGVRSNTEAALWARENGLDARPSGDNK